MTTHLLKPGRPFADLAMRCGLKGADAVDGDLVADEDHVSHVDCATCLRDLCAGLLAEPATPKHPTPGKVEHRAFECRGTCADTTPHMRPFGSSQAFVCKVCGALEQAPAVQLCERCGEPCSDFRQRDGQRICILCVERELEALPRLEATDLGQLLAVAQLCDERSGKGTPFTLASRMQYEELGRFLRAAAEAKTP